MAARIHNFNPGPAALPLPVLEEVKEEFLDFKGSGMSVAEISHRSALFEGVLNDAVKRMKGLLKLPDNFKVLFLQGGASSQFFMVPMNLLPEGTSGDYVNTGSWAKKAIREAQILKKSHRVIASSEDRNFSYIPQGFSVNNDAAYLHVTSNNTIEGTQWSSFPKAGNVPLVSDMSSDIMSRPFDATPFGLIYAGAQKNLCREELALQHSAVHRNLYGPARLEMDRGDDRRTRSHGTAKPGKSGSNIQFHRQ
jgi:phosphoserine aminotransferase